MEMDILTLDTIKTVFSNAEMDKDEAVVDRNQFNHEG